MFQAIEIISIINIIFALAQIAVIIEFKGVESTKMLMINNVSPVVFNLSYLIMSIVLFVFFQNLNYDNPCSDHYTTLIFGYFNERKKKLEAYTLVIMICHSVYLFLFLMLGLGALIYKLKSEYDKRRMYRRY